MAYNQNNPNGSATSANSAPVVIASDQAAIPITDNSGSLTVDAPVGTPAFVRLSDGSSAVSPATSALQTTGNTSLSSIDTKTPALGQALAAASVPIVLTAAQLTTLTPPAAITGFATAAKQPALGTAGSASADVLTIQGIASMTAIKTDGSGVTQPVSGTVTSNVGTTNGLALDATLTGGSQQIQGNIAAAATDSGNPIKVGGINKTTPPTLTDGQRGDLQVDTRSNVKVSLWAPNSNTAYSFGNGVSGTGVQRVAIASDNTAFSVNATLAAETTKVIGTVNIAASQTVGLVAGSAVIGKVGIDQTTPGTTNLVALAANQSVNVAQINGVTTLMGNGVTGTGSQRVTVASDNTPFAVKTDQTTHGTTDLVASDVTKIAGTAIVNGGVAGSQSVGGTVATNVAITANPINNGAQAVSSENAAVTTARQVQLVADLVGKLIVLPYANPENFVSGAITSAMTGTTTTSLIAAPASGLRNYITQITVSNAHATVGTDVIIQDGSGGTTLYTIPAAAVYGGAVLTFPTPLRQPTTATAIYCANVTTGASTKVSASGYKGA